MDLSGGSDEWPLRDLLSAVEGAPIEGADAAEALQVDDDDVFAREHARANTAAGAEGYEGGSAIDGGAVYERIILNGLRRLPAAG